MVYFILPPAYREYLLENDLESDLGITNPRHLVI